MKRHVQPLMQRSHLGYEYTGEDDESRLSKDPISDDAILVQLSKIFKNMKQAVPTAVLEYSAERPPNPDDVLLYFLMPPPLGLDQVRVDPRRPCPRRDFSQDDGETVVEEAEVDSSSEDDTVLSQYVMKKRQDKAGSSARSSKRPAENLEDDVPQPPRKKRNTVRKHVVRVTVNPDGTP
ncbi:hypothetical protein PVAP13_7NG106778, partial [Panicum virgatum]